jgi:hypothetical protein
VTAAGTALLGVRRLRGLSPSTIIRPLMTAIGPRMRWAAQTGGGRCREPKGEERAIRSLRTLVLALMIALALGVSACGGGGAKVRTDTTTVTLGQQLIDLQAAYDKGVITERQYNELKKKLIEKYSEEPPAGACSACAPARCRRPGEHTPDLSGTIPPASASIPPARQGLRHAVGARCPPPREQHLPGQHPGVLSLPRYDLAPRHSPLYSDGGVRRIKIPELRGWAFEPSVGGAPGQMRSRGMVTSSSGQIGRWIFLYGILA